jgi:hypothetical protein
MRWTTSAAPASPTRSGMPRRLRTTSARASVRTSLFPRLSSAHRPTNRPAVIHRVLDRGGSAHGRIRDGDGLCGRKPDHHRNAPEPVPRPRPAPVRKRRRARRTLARPARERDVLRGRRAGPRCVFAAAVSYDEHSCLYTGIAGVSNATVAFLKNKKYNVTYEDETGSTGSAFLIEVNAGMLTRSPGTSLCARRTERSPPHPTRASPRASPTPTECPKRTRTRTLHAPDALDALRVGIAPVTQHECNATSYERPDRPSHDAAS